VNDEVQRRSGMAHALQAMRAIGGRIEPLGGA
jgi:hypothetical protein